MLQNFIILMAAYFQSITIKALAILIFNIFYNHLICNIARAYGKIPPCPKMISPKLLPERSIFIEYFIRRCSFNKLYHLRHRNIRWIRDKKMNIINGNFALKNLNIMSKNIFA